MRSVHAVKVGDCILDGRKIYIQSMINVPSADIEGSIRQAGELEAAGCEIIRAAIPDMSAVRLIPAIKNAVKIPLVADIHFDYKDRVKAVAKACSEKNIPIRIGVNSGSLEKSILAKYGSPTAEALAESALYHARLLEECDFNDIVISIKSSDVGTMIKANRLLAEKCCYPLHLGVTEAGTEHMGIIKSSVGIGSLLCDGIGETIRVSLTADPVKEVYAAKDILKAIGKSRGVRLVSCPTCGRTRIDLISLAKKVEEAVKDIDKDITVAVMGCAVNGPGEAREADIGIAGGDGCALIFKKGEILRKVPEDSILDDLIAEINKIQE